MSGRNSLMLGLGVFAFALSACGLSAEQRDAIAKFSEASAVLAETASDQLVEVRNDYIQMRTKRQKLTQVTYDDGFDGPLTPANIGAPIRATTVLRNYGDLLLVLATDSQEQALRTAADKFTNSIRGLAADKRAISDEQLDAVGNAIVTIGGYWIEDEKADAIKEIVPAAHPQVARIGELLAEDFDPKADVIATAYVLEISDVMADTKIPLLEETRQSAVRTLAVDARELAFQGERKVSGVFPGVVKAARNMVGAHNRLVDLLISDELSVDGIAAYSKSVEELLHQLSLVRRTD